MLLALKDIWFNCKKTATQFWHNKITELLFIGTFKKHFFIRYDINMNMIMM